MNEEKEVLELYIEQQQKQINDLTQKITMLTTRNAYLEKELKQANVKVKEYDLINRKKRNSVRGFNSSRKVIT
jgi:predicted DNA binding CopG/RHH family protein